MYTIIIPCFNEEDYISETLKLVSKTKANQIIVVDDGSTDDTIKIAEEFDATIVKHKENKGKGAAVKSGAHSSLYEDIMFLDADLSGITVTDINAMLDLLDHYDFIKTSFERSSSYSGDGYVTKFCVKPYLRQLAPELERKFPQPLSGQFAIKKSRLIEMDLPDGWGIDISILLQSKNLTSANFKLNPIVNSPSNDLTLEKMANEVAIEIIKHFGLRWKDT